MPCRDDGRCGPDPDWGAIHAEREAIEDCKARLEKSEERRLRMIELLNRVCYLVEKRGEEKTYFSDETAAWWDTLKAEGKDHLKETKKWKYCWPDNDWLKHARWEAKVSEEGRDALARILCAFCRKVEEEKSQETYLSPELETWWEDHQIADAKRESHEARQKTEAIKERRRKKEQQEREKAEAEKQRQKDEAEYERLRKKLGK